MGTVLRLTLRLGTSADSASVQIAPEELNLQEFCSAGTVATLFTVVYHAHR